MNTNGFSLCATITIKAIESIAQMIIVVNYSPYRMAFEMLCFIFKIQSHSKAVKLEFKATTTSKAEYFE